jgi:hypothetical protein
MGRVSPSLVGSSIQGLFGDDFNGIGSAMFAPDSVGRLNLPESLIPEFVKS